MAENEVTIATSIAPGKNLAIQAAALHSWERAGFNIISVNTPEEIERLKASFPTIQFYPAVQDAREKFAKPYIYLDQIFAALKKCNSQVCGIVNSDIHFKQDGIKEYIFQEARAAFVFGARMDVVSLDAPLQGQWYTGFDYFFFNRRLVSIFPKEEFCLGLPWWDYWIVLVPLAAKIPIKRIISPVAFHVIHPTRYGLESWVNLGQTLGKYFTPSFTLNAENMGRYNQIIYHLINKHQRIIDIEYQAASVG